MGSVLDHWHMVVTIGHIWVVVQVGCSPLRLPSLVRVTGNLWGGTSDFQTMSTGTGHLGGGYKYLPGLVSMTGQVGGGSSDSQTLLQVGRVNWVVAYMAAMVLSVGQANNNIWVVDNFSVRGFVSETALQLHGQLYGVLVHEEHAGGILHG